MKYLETLATAKATHKLIYKDPFFVGQVVLNSGKGTPLVKLDDDTVIIDQSGAVQSTAAARTATSAGLTTGTIADGTSYVTVTSAGANNIIILPAPTIGHVVWLAVGSNGYELRSSAPASVAINGGTGAGAESAVGADVLVRCVCTSATTWIANKFTSIGTESALEAAA